MRFNIFRMELNLISIARAGDQHLPLYSCIWVLIYWDYGSAYRCLLRGRDHCTRHRVGSPHPKNFGPDSWKAHFDLMGQCEFGARAHLKIWAFERTMKKLNYYHIAQLGTGHGDDLESPQQGWTLDADLLNSAQYLNHKRLSCCPSAQSELMPRLWAIQGCSLLAEARENTHLPPQHIDPLCSGGTGSEQAP